MVPGFYFCPTWSQIRRKTQFFPQGKIALIMPGRCLGRGTAAASCLGTAVEYPFSASQRSHSIPMHGVCTNPMAFVQPGASYGQLGAQNTLPASRSMSGKQIPKKTKIKETGRKSISIPPGGVWHCQYRSLHKHCGRNFQGVVPQPQVPRRSGRSRDRRRAPCGSAGLSLEATTGLRNGAASSPPRAEHRRGIRAQLGREDKIYGLHKEISHTIHFPGPISTGNLGASLLWPNV